jgi:hypothetical protein
MKTGKEIKIDNFKNYNVVFGSVNNKHPKAVYINISAWAEPQSEEDVNYNRCIRDLHKKIKQSLFNCFDTEKYSDFMKERTIVDLDIRESGIRFGKRSFMSCEITLFLNSEIPVNSESMKIRLDEVLKVVLNTTLENNKVFKFYKKKK